MVLALKWIKKNAVYFNGDPNNITVGGESAGAASVSLLAVSPKLKGHLMQLTANQSEFLCQTDHLL